MEDTTQHYTPLPRRGGSAPKNRKPLIILAVIILAAVILGAIFMLRKPQESQTDQPEVTSMEEQEEPTPTEEPTIDKESVKIQVINGTGTPGDAGKVVALLKDEGFSADNIKTGNAEEFSTTDTTISAREGYTTVANDIEDILGDTFDDIEVDSDLEEDSEFDIVIVTGGEEYEDEEEETSPTAAPTSASSTSATATPNPSPTVTLTPTPKP